MIKSFFVYLPSTFLMRAVAFLTMVIVAMTVFAIAIAYASLVAGGGSPARTRLGAKSEPGEKIHR